MYGNPRSEFAGFKRAALSQKANTRFSFIYLYCLYLSSILFKLYSHSPLSEKDLVKHVIHETYKKKHSTVYTLYLKRLQNARKDLKLLSHIAWFLVWSSVLSAYAAKHRAPSFRSNNKHIFDSWPSQGQSLADLPIRIPHHNSTGNADRS